MNSSNPKSEPERKTDTAAPISPATSPLSPPPIAADTIDFESGRPIVEDWPDGDDLIQVHGRKFGLHDEPNFERMRRK